MKSKTLFLALSLFLLFVFSACGGKGKADTKEQQVASEKKTSQKEDTEEIKPDEGEKLKFRIINLYFVNPGTNTLRVEKRQVFDLKEETAMIKQVLRSLKLGPVSRLKPSVPDNVEFKDIFVYNNTVYIDLHKTDAGSSIGGVIGEELFISSVVKTVLDLSSNYKRVKFLIDGQETDSILGHIDCSKYFTRNLF